VENYSKIALELHNYCKNENYKGYNLLDSHNSFIPFRIFGKTISFLANQFYRRSPVNFRPVTGIKKTINPKAFGIFLNAYTKLKYLDLFDNSYLDELNHYFFNWLISNNCKNFKNYCWGYQYDWPQRNGNIVPANSPNVVVTATIIRGILNYYKLYNNYKAKEIISSAALFVLNDLHLTKTSKGYCFSYSPVKRDLNVNANLLAAEILAYDDFINRKTNHIDIIKRILEFTQNLQNIDGSWFYSFEIDSFKPNKQIDFHQGNILESLDLILKIYKIYNSQINIALSKGIEFYKNKQFNTEGVSKYRLPKIWPVDIHNQAQGIIIFSRFSSLNNEYKSFAAKIADWTIANLRSKKGFFYFQKWPHFTNKISYMRWNQAWMMLALVDLISVISGKSDKTYHHF